MTEYTVRIALRMRVIKVKLRAPFTKLPTTGKDTILTNGALERNVTVNHVNLNPILLQSLTRKKTKLNELMACYEFDLDFNLENRMEYGKT